MTPKNRKWSELTTDELAAGTREFDNPNFHAPARKPTAKQSAQLRRVQRKAAKDRFRVAVALDEDLEKIGMTAKPLKNQPPSAVGYRRVSSDGTTVLVCAQKMPVGRSPGFPANNPIRVTPHAKSK